MKIDRPSTTSFPPRVCLRCAPCSMRAAGMSSSHARAECCCIASQSAALRGGVGIGEGEEWAAFAPGSQAAELARGVPLLFTPPAQSASRAEVPSQVDETYPAVCSTQEAFGRVLGALSRLPVADRIVTVSAAVAVTTPLAGGVTRQGGSFPQPTPNPLPHLPH